MRLKSKITGFISGFLAMPAFAESGLEIIGQPVADGIGFQPAATKLAQLQFSCLVY
jgi:cytochrome c oxidase subunit 2